MQEDSATRYVKGLEATTMLMNYALHINSIYPTLFELKEIKKLEKYVGNLDAPKYFYYHDARASDLEECLLEDLIENYGFSNKQAKLYLDSNIFESETEAHNFLTDIENGQDFYEAFRKNVWNFVKPKVKSGTHEFKEKIIPCEEIDLFLKTFGFKTQEDFIHYACFKREYCETYTSN